MDLGSIFLIIALLLLVGLFISRPFLEPVVFRTVSENHQRSSLMAERDRVINGIKELDFDHTMGKIPDEDYPIQRAVLLKKGADILRQLDVINASEPSIETVEDRMEAAIASGQAVLQSAGPGLNSHRNPALADDELEIQIAARRRARQEKAAGFCPSCGASVQKSDRFCPRCGATLKK
jgi:hypothetical protein